jgi:hypothetical protein
MAQNHYPPIQSDTFYLALILPEPLPRASFSVEPWD